jgi:hypothetical protein
MTYETFDFKSFAKESKDVIVNSKDYFGTLKLHGGFTEPLLKSVIYGAVAGVFKLLWSMLNMTPVIGGLGGQSFGVLAFVWSVIASVMMLFIGTLIILIISSICEGNTDFEACLRISASLMVLLPVNALFGFVLGLNLTLGMFVTLLISLFALWLMYNSLIITLRVKNNKVKIVFYVLTVLVIISILVATLKLNSVNSYFKDFNPQI